MINPRGFELWYQPVYDVSSGHVVQNEVLLRWRDTQGSLHRPKTFMPVVSNAEAEPWLDRYVTSQAIAQLKAYPHLKLSINLSKRIVEDRSIAEDIYNLLTQQNVQPHQLHFEISEASLAQNFQDSVALVHDLKALGCSVILDNFANQHLTFLQWEKLGVDAVKLDASLIRDLKQDSLQTRLARAIIDTSVSLEQSAIAKSVDAYATSRHLHNFSVGSAQGYHFKPPSNRPWLTSKVEVLGVPIDNMTQADLLNDLKSGVVFTANLDRLTHLNQDQELRAAYNIADYKICDSQILYFASRLLGSPIQEQISGADLFAAFYTHHQNNPDITVFLLGGAPGVAAQTQQTINTRVGRDMVVGAYSPSASFDGNSQECTDIIEHINRSGATVLAIGVGSPIQERWIYRHRERLADSIKIIFAIDAILDLDTSRQQRGPLASLFGAKQLLRLISQPK
ncbi:EAL domain-containing protein [Acaryochloris sp. IP29b_bin.148]|uniref:EAL domain-containing protein n=1 Tax=Acaryochloris sp. IP29b_bin.148 TaxID=2969218 RepID=UPI002607D756|nr:EAL domain-containing protein [Acaryochloris sp. IP29b_bin.148]